MLVIVDYDNYGKGASRYISVLNTYTGNTEDYTESQVYKNEPLGVINTPNCKTFKCLSKEEIKLTEGIKASKVKPFSTAISGDLFVIDVSTKLSIKAHDNFFGDSFIFRVVEYNEQNETEEYTTSLIALLENYDKKVSEGQKHYYDTSYFAVQFDNAFVFIDLKHNYKQYRNLIKAGHYTAKI